jgi:hypothetical protein
LPTRERSTGGMAQTFEKIPDEFARWFESQPVFFVATAAAEPEARINVSPRGLDTFRVLDPNRVAWLDLTGSGVETIAHLKADGRITLMFCAFDGPPKVVRLYGRGRVYEPGDDAHEGLRPRFPDLPGARAVVEVAVERVSSSCGFGVPLMEFVGPHTTARIGRAQGGGEDGGLQGAQERREHRWPARTGTPGRAERSLSLP